MNKNIFTLFAVFALLVACGEKGPDEPSESAAPVLLETTPQNGVTDVTGTKITIKFTYDQSIQLAPGAVASIDGGASIDLTAPYASVLTVAASGLESRKTYTVTIPEGAVLGFKKNQKPAARVAFTFTTAEGDPDAPAFPGPDDVKRDAEGWEYASSAVRNMLCGWNLGNTLESNSGDLNNMWIEMWTKRTPYDYETAWGQPVATRALIHMFREAGFNAIRVPVTWYPHMGTFNVALKNVGGENKPVGDFSTWVGYDIDPVWMARVKEVVNYVIDEGMYCILNVHHDTGEASTAWLRADPAAYEKYKERYAELWKQIAKEFAGYDDHLLFESFNEMLDARGTWNSSTAEAHETINKWNADFVATVRATGGNNARRNLVCNTYAASTDTKALEAFRMPSDAVDGHLLAEVHSYAPYLFAFDQSTYPVKQVFDDSCDREVRGIIDNLNSYFVSKGIPCIIGEYGCTGSRTELERAKQAACYVSAATKYDIACFCWMTLSDTTDRSVPKWTTPKIKNAIVNAYKENKKSN